MALNPYAFRLRMGANVKYPSTSPGGEGHLNANTAAGSVLFNGNATAKCNEVFLSSPGELDALNCIQNGFENAIGTTVGAGSFDAAWVGELQKCKKIYLCYDSDEGGQKGARAVAKRLGYNRCWNVLLPSKDANEYFQQNGADRFTECLKKAVKQFSLPGIVTTQTALDLLQGQIESGEDRGGILTPWPNVNRIISGRKPGDLIVVTAPPKTGKTTFCLDITRDLVLGGTPCLFWTAWR